MDCALATLLACFSWSNLYVDIGVSYQDAWMDRVEIHTREEVLREFGRRTLTYSETTSSYSNDASNPYGHIALGYELQFDNITWTVEFLSHDSSLATSKDRGANAIRLNARWFPFRR